jgi:hypothetical protein
MLELRWREVEVGERVEHQYVLGRFDHVGPRFSLAKGSLILKRGEDLEERKRQELLSLRDLLVEGLLGVERELGK